jgi:hypothetical protein
VLSHKQQLLLLLLELHLEAYLSQIQAGVIIKLNLVVQKDLSKWETIAQNAMLPMFSIQLINLASLVLQIIHIVMLLKDVNVLKNVMLQELLIQPITNVNAKL